MLHEITVIHCNDAAFRVLVASVLILPVGGSVSNNLVVIFRFHVNCCLKSASSTLFGVPMLRVGVFSVSGTIMYKCYD
jgi:hypothetical protein